jgi:hypothetical protein
LVGAEERTVIATGITGKIEKKQLKEEIFLLNPYPIQLRKTG